MIKVFQHCISVIALLLQLLLLTSNVSSAVACSGDCLAVKQTLVNGQRNITDAFGRYVNLTTTLESNGFEIKRIFVQRNYLRADYRSCQPSKDKGDVVCSFPAFNLFYGRKPDAKSGDVLTFDINALGENQLTGETKTIKGSFSVKYFPNRSKTSLKTIHARKGILFVMHDPGNAQLSAPKEFARTLTGKVVNGKNHMPINGAKIRIFPIITVAKKSKIQMLSSAEDGSFEIESAAPYSFSLYVEAQGYKPFSSGVLSQVKQLELQLEQIKSSSQDETDLDQKDLRLHPTTKTKISAPIKAANYTIKQ